MLNLSLRAVFRKESWMFCAGLLLSIADLLKFFDLHHTNCALGNCFGHSNQQHVPLGISAAGTRGENPASSPPRFPKAAQHTGSCEYDTASPCAFQPGTFSKLAFPARR